MHVQRYQRYQHANTRPMRPLQTCKHANMRRYQGSRRYQRYQRSRRRKRHANHQSRDHAHANTAVTPKIPKIAKTQHANWQTKLPSPPPHARKGVRNHTRRSSSTRSPTTYASQNHLRCTRRLTHTCPCIGDARRTNTNAKRLDTNAIT